MKQLDIVQKLKSAFGQRGLCHHAEKRGVEVCVDEDHRTALVFDLSISHQILISKSFKDLNYFEEGYQHFSGSPDSLEFVRRFFAEGPLFLEGEVHRNLKKNLNDLLKQQADHLRKAEPRIAAYMRKRKKRFGSPIAFSHAFVEMCLGMMISHLSSLPLKSSLRALRARKNVFYFHFHPLRHKGGNHALSFLEKLISHSKSGLENDHKFLLCGTLILMGYDPLFGTICASIMDGRTHELGKNVERYCPTSFVSRLCVEPVSIGNTSFEKGDICYVSLVPASDEDTVETFPFGAGAHICIGRNLTLQILQLAERIIASDFADGFSKNLVLSPDGAFLSFRETPSGSD